MLIENEKHKQQITQKIFALRYTTYGLTYKHLSYIIMHAKVSTQQHNFVIVICG